MQNKSIWYKSDITPDPCRILICKTNKGQNYTAIIPSSQQWNTMILPEFYSIEDIDNAERIEQYAYLDDLLALETELDRTKKQLKIAVDALKSAHEYYQNCVIRERQPHEINWYCTAMNMDNDISEALEQITALEQKDVK